MLQAEADEVCDDDDDFGDEGDLQPDTLHFVAVCSFCSCILLVEQLVLGGGQSVRSG